MSWSPRRDATAPHHGSAYLRSATTAVLLKPYQLTRRSTFCRVQVYHNFMTADECDHLVNISRPLVRLSPPPQSCALLLWACSVSCDECYSLSSMY